MGHGDLHLNVIKASCLQFADDVADLKSKAVAFVYILLPDRLKPRGNFNISKDVQTDICTQKLLIL